jgi:Flp pilus assembly protein TadG
MPGRKRVIPHLRSERGQALTEFALVLPLLAVLLFGIIQFGVVFNNYLTLTDAARAGARKAVVSRHLGPSGATDAATTAVKNSAVGLTGDLQITVAPAAAWQPGTDVTVTASYPYSISLLDWVIQSGRLSSSTTERIE